MVRPAGRRGEVRRTWYLYQTQAEEREQRSHGHEDGAERKEKKGRMQASKIASCVDLPPFEFGLQRRNESIHHDGVIIDDVPISRHDT